MYAQIKDGKIIKYSNMKFAGSEYLPIDFNTFNKDPNLDIATLDISKYQLKFETEEISNMEYLDNKVANGEINDPDIVELIDNISEFDHDQINMLMSLVNSRE